MKWLGSTWIFDKAYTWWMFVSGDGISNFAAPPGGRSTRGGCTGESVLYGVCWHRSDDHRPAKHVLWLTFALRLFGWDVKPHFPFKRVGKFESLGMIPRIRPQLYQSFGVWLFHMKSLLEEKYACAPGKKFSKVQSPWGSQNQDEIGYPGLAILNRVMFHSLQNKGGPKSINFISTLKNVLAVFWGEQQFYRIDTRWQKDKRIQKS